MVQAIRLAVMTVFFLRHRITRMLTYGSYRKQALACLGVRTDREQALYRLGVL